MAQKKKEIFNPIEQLQGILQKDQWKFEDGDSGDKVYSEIPVGVEEFVTSKDWLGIAPQRNPDTGEIPPSPLSDAQLEFLESITDLENNVNDYVLWVPGPKCYS